MGRGVLTASSPPSTNPEEEKAVDTESRRSSPLW